MGPDENVKQRRRRYQAVSDGQGHIIRLDTRTGEAWVFVSYGGAATGGKWEPVYETADEGDDGDAE